MPQRRLTTSDGFSLDLRPPTGGLSVHDFAANADFAAPAAALVQQPDGAIALDARDDALGLALTATYRVIGSALRIDGEVRDLTGRDRAVTVRFACPADAVGWRWYDDQNSVRTIEAGKSYDNLVSSGAGANGRASRYPLTCIGSDSDCIALAVPLDVPRLCRLGYDATSRELYAETDLGLASDTESFPSKASFSLVLYRPDQAWGFRSALQRYYALFPQCFTKRNAKEGIWMPFTDISKVEGWQDFGFQFKEGDNNVAWDAEHGIYSFVYVEPWSDWVAMPKEMPRTVEQATAYVKERAAEGHEKDQAVLSSAYAHPDGSWAARIEDQPWCDGAVFGVNPSPGVTAQPGHITQYESLINRINHAFERSPQLTGVYHDSFEMYLFHNWISYRREHWRKAAIPLVFDSEGRVGQYAMFTMVEFAKDIAERMWASGHMTFANGTPHAFPWGAAWLDVMGTEAAWASQWGKFGEYVPESANDFNYWRAICYRRPYLMLLNTRYDLWKPEWIELYMKRCVAWGVFPSFFSHNASEDPYWQNPALYNAHRPLFRKYLPLVQALGAAGWEPVTHARSDNPSVYLERFGSSPDKVFLTVYNDSEKEQTASVTLDLSQLGSASGKPALRDLLAGAPVAAAFSPGTAAFEVRLPAGDIKVIAIE
ncbi:MAG: hypothetical protein ACE149_19960 [Armatimonadota bacterium]